MELGTCHTVVFLLYFPHTCLKSRTASKNETDCLWDLLQPLEPASLELAGLLAMEEGASQLEAGTPGKHQSPLSSLHFVNTVC